MSILNTVLNQSNDRLLTDEQVELITTAKPETVTNDPGFINNLVTLMTMYTFDETLEIVKTKDNLEEYMFETSLFDPAREMTTNMYIKTLKQPRFITGFYKCRSCNSDQVRTRTLQTRSGDESSTDYNKCMKCGKQWSVN